MPTKQRNFPAKINRVILTTLGAEPEHWHRAERVANGSRSIRYETDVDLTILLTNLAVAGGMAEMHRRGTVPKHQRIGVSCTKCGNLLIDAVAAPDKCPKCGAGARFDHHCPDYVAKPWEEIDVCRRMWGVFDAEGLTPSPFAIFQSEDLAVGWLTWQRALGDNSAHGNVHWTVMPIDALTGHAWNSYETPPPREGSS